jgi:hypothetical protein
MKTARIGFMALGIVLLMFVVVPLASAQPYFVGEWFKGKVSFKGYDITDDLTKDSGSSPIYVNFVQGTEVITVTTCTQDRSDKNVYHPTTPTTIPLTQIYTNSKGNFMIWDFGPNYMEFYGPAYAYPTFTAKFNGNKTKLNFSSIACTAYDETGTTYAIGSCSMTFQNLDSARVPTACIVP